MPFAWLRRRRRRRLLARPFPAHWEEILAQLDFVGRLSEEDGRRLRDLLRVLEAEKSWEGQRGLDVTEEMRVVIAAQAALLVLRLDIDAYSSVHSILVYPEEFRALHGRTDEIGIVHEGEEHSGESWDLGFLVLSWSDVLAGIEDPGQGYNVVFHEFAHVLDQATGWLDGTPDLGGRVSTSRWREVMTREFEALAERAESGKRTFLDPYGATDEAEFFAVVTESFFDRPRALRKRHPDLHEVLAAFYAQDPARWEAAS